MSESKPSSVLDPDDDAPDLSTPEWQAEFAKASVRRGRPKLEEPKVLTTIRLDREVLAFFQKDGDGWQTRINDALRGLALGKSAKPKPAARAGKKSAWRQCIRSQ